VDQRVVPAAAAVLDLAKTPQRQHPEGGGAIASGIHEPGQVAVGAGQVVGPHPHHAAAKQRVQLGQ
jgi:hypothetical protein